MLNVFDNSNMNIVFKKKIMNIILYVRLCRNFIHIIYIVQLFLYKINKKCIKYTIIVNRIIQIWFCCPVISYFFSNYLLKVIFLGIYNVF